LSLSTELKPISCWEIWSWPNNHFRARENCCLYTK